LKIALREKKRLERLAHSPGFKKRKDSAITEKIRSLDAFKKAKFIAFYMPLHGEVDLTSLFRKYQTKKTFLLPKCFGARTLRFYPVKNLKNLIIGKFKIPEPLPVKPSFNKKNIDLILVPGLAFDKKGFRLGYGKGYYDSFLGKAGCIKIGIAYDFQLVKNVPADPTDVPMDLVITEKEVIQRHAAAA